MFPNDGQVIVISSDDEDIHVQVQNELDLASVLSIKSEPVDFLTIDVGQHNLAYLAGAYQDGKVTVREWRLIDLNLKEKYDPVDITNKTMAALERISAPYSVVLIERQIQFFNVPSQGKLGKQFKTMATPQSIKNTVIEAIIHCRMSHRQVESINQKAVKSFWNTSGSSHYQRKTAAVQLTKKLIAGEQLQWFMKQKKKDDLADALLMTLFYFNCKVPIFWFLEGSLHRE